MFTTLLYQPLYNALVFLTHIFGGNIGLAVIGLTLIIKVLLWPLAWKAFRVQKEQQKLAPLVEAIKKQYPDSKEQSQKLMELYKEHKTNPFSGCLVLLIQIPIIMALYRVFLGGIHTDTSLLYSFLHIPTELSPKLLGVMLSEKSIIFACCAGIAQFVQLYFSPAMVQASPTDVSSGDNPTTAMMQSMTKSMKYTLPIMIGFFSYMVPGAVALYWIATSIITFGQEQLFQYMYVRRG